MSKLVTIYGGSGFVGRYIARRMAQAGWRVRVATRRPNEALFVRPYGVVGQVEPVLCNIRDEASVRAALQGADAVVNCVGLLNAVGKNTFDALQSEGAARVARLAAAEGVQHLVHISAIGADAGSDSDYSRTKGEGEAAVLANFPSAVILRPSVLFGNEDKFFNRLGLIARMSPVMPVFGAESKFQPAYVEDVAAAAVMGATGEAAPGIYELGGPDVETLADLTRATATIVNRRRLALPLPRFVGRLIAFGFGTLQTLSGGLIENKILTADQLKNLYRDNVVAPGAKGFADLGITPTAYAAVLPDYMWPYRPSGQFDAIKASAKNVRKA
ncbi:complex I NDUFA9 subunit family protein [Gemmobacter serpentinus]|uniref:complex I NDUFA9 subunit family protein n=1 Tax=Gemmobacter serpentinus TaxID=2652247 RepID=UPI00124DA97E|nr:complex I NDUFA9 subunit family protein [Gemmobacter serpentinus]